MDRRHRLERPFVVRLGDDLADLGLDVLGVGLVLQMGDAFSARRVVADGPEKAHHGAALRGRNGLDEGAEIDRIRGNRHQIGAAG